MKKRYYKVIIEHLEFELEDAREEIRELEQQIKRQGPSTRQRAEAEYLEQRKAKLREEGGT